MDYIILALVGLVVGAIAKFLVPGKQGGGIIVTALLGVVGSLPKLREYCSSLSKIIRFTFSSFA